MQPSISKRSFLLWWYVLALLLVLSAARKGKAEEDVPAPILESVFKVECEYEAVRDGKKQIVMNHGTGFRLDLTDYGVDSKRYVLTNAHTVYDEAEKGKFTKGDRIRLSKRHGAKVKAVDHVLDLCLLESEGDLAHGLQLAGELPASGAAVLLLAGLGPAIPAPYRGYYVSGVINDGSLCQIAVTFWHGGSGGPVLRRNRVVGVASSGVASGDGGLVPGIALAIPVTTVKAFLEKALKVKVKD